jgi:cation:H+ antiporter
MAVNILAIISLLVLFLVLSKSADLIVLNLKKIGKKLGIKIFVLGLVLGAITSLPELAIGINSLIKDVPDISFGHLMGGNIVLLGLILSISIILNRRIKTESSSKPFLITLLFLFLPLVLALNGELNFFNGLILIILYIALIYYLYKDHHKKHREFIKINIVDKDTTSKNILFIVIGLLGVMLSSELIVRTTLFVLEDYNISPFIVGLLFYSIGTNLPELTIALRSFRRKVEELSFSNLIGATISHVLILGIFSFIKTIKVDINISYIFLIISSLVLFVVLYIFYRSDRLLSRLEGYVLLAMYLIFVIGQIFLQIIK